MKNLKNLGKVLGKKEQKSINGGNPGHCTEQTCYDPCNRVWHCIPITADCPWPDGYSIRC